MNEFTWHRSDAVDKYQVTSDEQKESLSKIIHGEVKPNVAKVTEELKLELSGKHVSEMSNGPNIC